VEAERIYTDLKMPAAAADIHQNLGLLAARRGDLPTALCWLDPAEEWGGASGMVAAAGLLDRCMALLAAHLVAEARQAAENAVRPLGAEGRTQVAQAHWLAAHAPAPPPPPGRPGGARGAPPPRARRAFGPQGRPGGGAAPRHAEIRAAWQAGD